MPATSPAGQDVRPGAAPGQRRLELLLLCDFPAPIAENVDDSIRALTGLSRHRVRALPAYGGIPPGLDLNRFDGLVVHWTIAVALDSYMGPATREAIRQFRGVKAAFVQDDYRHIVATANALSYLGMHVVFGLAEANIIDRIYPPDLLPGVRRETVLPGYVPSRLTALAVRPYGDRPIDVGYRGRTVPAWVGRLGRDKALIADRFIADAERYGLSYDISAREDDRLYGAQWTEFLCRCKATLGTESGASVFDASGELQRRVTEHGIRDPRASYDDLYELYVEPFEEPVPMSVISSRCFEAAALRTLMVLYEGPYSGRLVPWRHYVPLAKDHSNIEEVVAILRDTDRAQAMVDCAFREVALDPANNFTAFARRFDAVIDDVFAPAMAATGKPYDESRFQRRFCRARRRRRQFAVRLNTLTRRVLTQIPPPVGPILYRVARSAWRRWRSVFAEAAPS